MHLTIVGAGPAGLAAAIAARDCGFEATVYEQAADFSYEQGCWLINPNGMRALSALQLLEPLSDRLHFVRQAVLEADGWPLFAMEYGEREAATVLRRDLLDTMLATAQRRGVTLHFEHRLVGADLQGETVCLTFRGGMEVTGSAVIGADGKRSLLRHSLPFSTTRRDPGLAYLRGVVDVAAKPFPLELWTADGRRFGIDPAPGGRTGFYCTAPNGHWSANHAAIEPWIAGWEEAGGERIAAVLRAVPDWSRVRHEEPLDIRVHPWALPPVFLIGDAAHAQVPNLGQGANQALVDAVILVRLLKLWPHLAAREFETLRRGFVTRLQNASWWVGSLSGWRGASDRWLRDGAARLASRMGWMRQQGTHLVRGWNPSEASWLAADW